MAQHFTMSQQLSGSIDRWIARQRDPSLTRPEAIRRLIEAGLNARDKLSAASPGGSGASGSRKPPTAPRARKPAPKAKALSMSKEAQIRALREQDAG